VRAGDTWRTCTTRPLLRPQVIAKGGRWVLGVRGEPVAKVELLDARDGTPTLLWENRSNAFPGYRGGGFSKDGTVVWARMFPWTLLVRDLATGRENRFDLPQQLCDQAFTPDGAHVVYQTWRREGTRDPNNPNGSYVLTIATGKKRALPVVGAHTWTTHNTGVYFTRGGAAIYHIRLDGTGLERVFPTKQALTLAEFEAEASP